MNKIRQEKTWLTEHGRFILQFDEDTTAEELAGEEEERRVLEEDEEFEQFATAMRRHGTHFTKARHLAPRSESSKCVQAAGRRRFFSSLSLLM